MPSSKHYPPALAVRSLWSRPGALPSVLRAVHEDDAGADERRDVCAVEPTPPRLRCDASSTRQTTVTAGDAKPVEAGVTRERSGARRARVVSERVECGGDALRRVPGQLGELAPGASLDLDPIVRTYPSRAPRAGSGRSRPPQPVARPRRPADPRDRRRTARAGAGPRSG